MIKNILCSLGFHKWSEWCVNGDFKIAGIKSCKHCKKEVIFQKRHYIWQNIRRTLRNLNK